jgi:hypothetical protein
MNACFENYALHQLLTLNLVKKCNLQDPISFAKSFGSPIKLAKKMQ